MRTGVLLLMCFVIACAPKGVARDPILVGSPPELLLGEFRDDYDIEYLISAQDWHQHPGSRYRVVAWHAAEKYLIAQNDAANPVDPGLWTRIDWILLPDMAPYDWAFCLSAYKAASREEAESSETANRDSPRTGCNGFPFSRMRIRLKED